jgi:hypothetical protein
VAQKFDPKTSSGSSPQSGWPADAPPGFVELSEALGRTPRDLELAKALFDRLAENRARNVAVLVPSESVQNLGDGFQVIAQYVTDEQHTFVRLKRLIVEPDNWNDASEIKARVLQAIRLDTLRAGALHTLGQRADFQPGKPPRKTRGRQTTIWPPEELARCAQVFARNRRSKKKRKTPYVHLVDDWTARDGTKSTRYALVDAIRRARKEEILDDDDRLTEKGRKLAREAKRKANQ